MRRAAALIALAAPPAAAQTAEAMIAKARTLPERCIAVPGDEVVVCGRADAARRYRLPIPSERGPAVPAASLSAAEALNVPGDCGPFGQRRCSRREALSQGYGGGRDPITLAARLARQIVEGE